MLSSFAPGSSEVRLNCGMGIEALSDTLKGWSQTATVLPTGAP
jgi:hypothetical protein